MTQKREPHVTVYLDGKPRVVPKTLGCDFAARGALGLRRGEAVGCADKRSPLAFEGGHTFSEGDRYVTLSFFEALGSMGLDVGEREPWQEDPDAWKDASPHG